MQLMKLYLFLLETTAIFSSLFDAQCAQLTTLCCLLFMFLMSKIDKKNTIDPSDLLINERFKGVRLVHRKLLINHHFSMNSMIHTNWQSFHIKINTLDQFYRNKFLNFFGFSRENDFGARTDFFSNYRIQVVVWLNTDTPPKKKWKLWCSLQNFRLSFRWMRNTLVIAKRDKGIVLAAVTAFVYTLSVGTYAFIQL